MRSILVWLTAAACTAACSSSENHSGAANDASVASDSGVAGCLSSSECPTGWVCDDFHRCEPPSPTGDAGVPPETEYVFGAPISSDRFVYVAMTSENKLARIDGRTLAVTATAVGASPAVVRTIPGSDGAVVLDAANGTATVVRPTINGDGTRVLPTLHDLNRLDIDPSGRYAVIWFDLAQHLQDGGLGGIGSFQDVTLVALAPGNEVAVDLTVGFQPRDVQFDATGDRAYVVTQDGVSVIDFAAAIAHGPMIVPAIPVADPGVAPADLEVSIVATGDYAAVRQLDAARIRIVGLRAPNVGHTWDIPLASAATDLDLAPDGARVYAVERDAKQLAIIDVPGDAIDPSGVVSIDLSDATIGSLVVSRDGTRALLFTNATLDDRITMVALDQPGFPHVTWALRKAVRAVGISPSGSSALLLDAKAPGDPDTATSVDDFIAESYGFTLLDLATGFSKLQLTPVDPAAFIYAPDGSKAYIALDGGDNPTATRALQIIDAASGVVTTLPLGSPPSALGIVPGANEAFVAQRHPLGRVSFVDLVTGAVRTITGFDLNSQVVD